MRWPFVKIIGNCLRFITIVGGGSVGNNVARLLAQEEWDVRVIEQDKDIIENACTENNPIYFLG